MERGIFSRGAKSDAGYFLAVPPGAERLSPGGPRGAGAPLGFCFKYVLKYFLKYVLIIPPHSYLLWGGLIIKTMGLRTPRNPPLSRSAPGRIRCT